MNKKTWIILGSALVVHLLLLTKVLFTAWPEMILWPYLNINGWELYKDIAIAHTPLLLLKLDIFFKLFGVGILQLKVITWMLILLLDLIVFFVTQKLFTKKIAVVTVASFIFWQVFFEGNGLWFDLFMGILAFISFYFVQKKNWVLAGVFWALAFLSKQSAVWFLLPIGLSILNDAKLWIKNLSKFITSSVSVVATSLLIFWVTGILPDFFNWAVKFGISELPRAQGQIQLPDLKNLAIAVFPFLILLLMLVQKKKPGLNLLFWSIAGAFGAYPRFEYFHIQPAIPYLAIASALVLTSDWHKRDLIKAFLPVYMIGCLYLFSGFMVRNYGEGTRFYEDDVKNVISYVKENTNKGDKIFVLNWWDSIYALTDTLPATDPWVPQLSWYQEQSGIQEKEVSDLSTTNPKLIILSNYSEVGLASYKPQKVHDYVLTNYKLKEKFRGIQIFVPR